MSDQELFLVFAKQQSPFDPEEMVDPLVGIVTDELACEKFEVGHPDCEVSWERRLVKDAEGHLIETGDTVYVYHYAAAVRKTSEGRILDLLTEAAIESIMYKLEHAHMMLKIGDIQIVTVGDFRVKGDFPVLDNPWDNSARA